MWLKFSAKQGNMESVLALAPFFDYRRFAGRYVLLLNSDGKDRLRE